MIFPVIHSPISHPDCPYAPQSGFVSALGPEAPKKQFIASLDASYPLQVSYGPGAASSEIQILIRLKQTVNGKVTYTKLASREAINCFFGASGPRLTV